MERFFNYMLYTSVMVAIVIIFIMIVSPIRKKKYSNKWRYYVWLILTIRLLLPIDISFPMSAIQLPRLVNPNVNTSITDTELDTRNEEDSVDATKKEEIIQDSKYDVSSKWKSLISYTKIKNFVMNLWIAITILLFIYQIVGYYVIRRRLRRWSIKVSNANMLYILEQVKDKLEIKSTIPVSICKKVSSPMITGFIHPQLLLPHDGYKAEDLSIIFTHELIHYKRKDIWYKTLLILARTMHWFNPFVYIMNKLSNRDLEFICDEVVIKDMDKKEREHYSNILLQIVQQKTSMQLLFTTNFNGGYKNIKDRLIIITSENKKKKGYILLGFIICFILLSGVLFVYKNDEVGNKVTNLTLPEEDKPLVVQMANSEMGIQGVPELIYGSKQRVILYDYWGLIVYDLEQCKIIRAVDLSSIGMNHIQGDQYTQVRVNKDGTQILMYNLPERYADPKLIYLYDIESDFLTETTNTTFKEGDADNLYDISSEEIVKALGTQSMNGLKGRTYAYVDNRWIVLRMNELQWEGGTLAFDNMMNLTINVIDPDKNHINSSQVFVDYVNLE